MRFFKILILLLLIFKISYSQDDDLNIKQLNFKIIKNKKFVTAPAVSFDGNYLIFVIRKNDKYKFYESKKNDSIWMQPSEISEINNFFGKNTYINSPIYNYDASKIYFEADNNNNRDIFCSQRTKNGWTNPVGLPPQINSPADEGEPSISPDNNTLYFVRFLDDYDCGKIFFSKKNMNFKWDTAKALISPINTDCERTPRILADNKTLLLASERDDNDLRIYHAKNLYNNIWLLPEIVSEFSRHDNLYPSVDYKNEKIYFASSRNKNNSEIFSANLPTKAKIKNINFLYGKITDLNNNPLSAQISFLDPVSMIPFGRFESNKYTGNYQIILPDKDNFLIDFSAKNYSHKIVNFSYNDKNDTINVKLFNKVELFLKVFDKDIFEPLNVDITIFDDKNNNKINFEQNKIAKGRYKIFIPIGKKYRIELSNPFSEKFSFDFDLSGTVIFDKFEKNIEIVSKKIEYSFKVIDNKNKEPINCEIVLTNLSTNQKIVIVKKTDKKGLAKVYVRKGDYYDVTINPQGYAFFNTEFEVKNESSKNINVSLQALKKDVKIELNNITFETNSADLNAKSHKELKKVIDLLKNNPQIKVEISAHTDDIGSEEYNKKLSDRRAESVVNYLIMNDVPKNRLIFKGYGETQPLVPNNSDKNRALNRRVELKITEVK